MADGLLAEGARLKADLADWRRRAEIAAGLCQDQIDHLNREIGTIDDQATAILDSWTGSGAQDWDLRELEDRRRGLDDLLATVTRAAKDLESLRDDLVLA